MDEFLIFGHPNLMVRQSPDGSVVEAQPFFLRTGRYHGDTSAASPSHGEVDLFLEYRDSVFDRDGRKVSAPTLPGISGTPIWAVMHPSQSIWSPDTGLAVVAIQSAYTPPGSKHRYLVGKMWTAIMKAFQQVNREAAREIHESLFL